MMIVGIIQMVFGLLFALGASFFGLVAIEEHELSFAATPLGLTAIALYVSGAILAGAARKSAA